MRTAPRFGIFINSRSQKPICLFHSHFPSRWDESFFIAFRCYDSPCRRPHLAHPPPHLSFSFFLSFFLITLNLFYPNDAFVCRRISFIFSGLTTCRNRVEPSLYSSSPPKGAIQLNPLVGKHVLMSNVPLSLSHLPISVYIPDATSIVFHATAIIHKSSFFTLINFSHFFPYFNLVHSSSNLAQIYSRS